MAGMVHQYTSTSKGQLECLEWLENLQFRQAVEQDKYWTPRFDRSSQSSSSDLTGTCDSTDDDSDYYVDEHGSQQLRRRKRRLDLLFDDDIDPVIHQHMSIEANESTNDRTKSEMPCPKFYPNRTGIMTQFNTNLDLLYDAIRIDVHKKERNILTDTVKETTTSIESQDETNFHTSQESLPPFIRQTSSYESAQQSDDCFTKKKPSLPSDHGTVVVTTQDHIPTIRLGQPSQGSLFDDYDDGDYDNNELEFARQQHGFAVINSPPIIRVNTIRLVSELGPKSNTSTPTAKSKHRRLLCSNSNKSLSSTGVTAVSCPASSRRNKANSILRKVWKKSSLSSTTHCGI
jgi:hypothetical protein